MKPTYIRDRAEAALVARIARTYQRRTSINDVYANDRYLINIAARLFGADPRAPQFIVDAHHAIMRLRKQRAQR